MEKRENFLVQKYYIHNRLEVERHILGICQKLCWMLENIWGWTLHLLRIQTLTIVVVVVVVEDNHVPAVVEERAAKQLLLLL